MSQPIRVEGWAYTPGARVSLRLQFRSQNSYVRVKAEFHNPSGQVIRLEGVSHPREESGAAHTEVVLTGRVPESAALDTYQCRSVQGAYWRQELGTYLRRHLSSKTPPSTSAWSNAPSTPKEGESFWDLSQGRGRNA
jgi:hypothetical protein